MTIEECVIEIQNGKTELMPELWNRVRGLYWAKVREYYNRNKARCDRCGATAEDLMQQSFFAFLRSIEAYEPLCELSFSAYINYPFLTEMQELTCRRTGKQKADALNMCDSLDREIDNDDGSSSTIGEFVEDPEALYFIELIDDLSAGQMIRAEVDRLRDPLRIVITGFFFDKKTLEQLGKLLGVSMQRAAQLKRDGLNELRKRRVLVELWNETHHTDRLRDLERSAHGYRPEQFAAVHSLARQAI